MTNLFERTVADAKASFRDRIREFGSAVTVGVFIGAAITTGTLLGLAVFSLSQKANLLRIARHGKGIIKKINDEDGDDEDSDADGGESAGAGSTPTVTTRDRVTKLEARVAELERLLAAKA